MAIVLNSVTKIISITTPTTEVTIQELVNTIRDWEDELENLSFKKVIDAVGKADLGGSVYTAITMTLSDLWQIQFWNGVTIGIVKGGNLVGGVSGNPIKATTGSDTIIVNNQVGGTISVTGSGITEQDKLDISDRVWDEQTSGHMTAGSAGKSIYDLPSGMTKAETVSKFNFMMLDTNGDPATGKTVTSRISKDGAAFAAITDTATEIGFGMYEIDISNTEMDADTIGLVFTAAGCKQTSISIVTT